MLSIIALNTFIAFHYCFKYHLSLYALSLFNAFHYYFKYIYRFPQRFKYIYRFPQCFKYIYRFHLHLLLLASKFQ